MATPSSPLSLPVKDDIAKMNGLWKKSKAVAYVAWSRTTRRVRLAALFFVLLIVALYISHPVLRTWDVSGLPTVHLGYDEQQQQQQQRQQQQGQQHQQEPAQLRLPVGPPSPYNESKVALLIENRPMPLLAPLMLHFMSVVPPEWRFRFMGSTESVAHLNKSVAIREKVAIGKLDLTYIPSNMSTTGQEMISRFLTSRWIYETVLAPAEWLLVFQTDSILCANSRRTVNDYLEYDWIGAPWHVYQRYGGNGGLSLRRVSSILEVLRDQERVDGSEPEDIWLAERLAHRPGAKMANGSAALGFSGEMYPGRMEGINKKPTDKYADALDAAAHGENVEGLDDWRAGFYEPMGYHTGGTGSMLHGGIWGTADMRKHIWSYCPEVKMTLAMDAARFVPGQCGATWKRDLNYWESVEAAGELGGEDASGAYGLGADGYGYGTEVIDGVEYPLLPPSLEPW